jgi:ribosomal 50S subunit-recycling heat shock protein
MMAKKRSTSRMDVEVAKPYKPPPPTIHISGEHAKAVHHVKPGKRVTVRVEGKVMNTGIDEYTGKPTATLQVHRVRPTSSRPKKKGR